MAKNGSKLLTGVISFLLGFLFAIIVEVGAIFGVYWYVTNTDLEGLMTTLGIQNTDEEGNHKYINTDPETGVSSIAELVVALQQLVYQDGELVVLGKSFDDIENLIPATNMALDFLYNTIDDYIELDKTEFEATPLSSLPQLLSDSLMQVKVANVMTKLEMDSFVGEEANAIMKSLIMGAETDYATVVYGAAAEEGGEAGEQFRLPVFYDVYLKDTELGYLREKPINNVSRYPENLTEDWIAEGKKDENGTQLYNIYYVPCKVNLETGRIEEADYSAKEIEVEVDGKTRLVQVLDYGADTEFIVLNSTSRDADGNFVLSFDDVKHAHETCAADSMHSMQYPDPYGRTYYNVDNDGKIIYPLNVICGKNYFRNNAKELVQLNALTLGDIVEDPFKPLYSVSIVSVVGEDSDVARKVFGDYSVGELLDGKVPFDEIANEMEISAFINNITPQNKIMAYVAHRVSDLKLESDGTYSAVYDKFGENEQNVKVTVEDGYISQVIAADGVTVLDGVLVSEIAPLTNSMTVNILMDVNVDEPVMAYLAYGLTGVSKAAEGATDPQGAPYGYAGKYKVGGIKKDCFITTQTVGEGGDAKNIIREVWYINDEGQKVKVAGTRVNAVATLMESFTSELTLGDVIALDENNHILNAIKDTPICDLGERIKVLSVSDIFTEEEIERNAILRQLRTTRLDNLANEIDSLLIQTIYAEEVYGLSEEDAKLMEVVEFTESDYALIFELRKDENTGKYDFIKIAGDGTFMTQEQFDARGQTVYYTNKAYTDGDDSMKVLGFDERFLYYVYDEGGALKLADINCEGLEAGTNEYDDQLGHLTKAQYDELRAQGKKVYTYGDAKGMWRLVLYKSFTVSDGGVNTTLKREKAYTINNFNNMVNICAQNVNDATLTELTEAGVIKVSSDDLNKSFYGYRLGSLKLSELITLVVNNAT